MDADPALEAEAGHQLGRDLVLVDHGAVDPVHFRKLVAVGDVGQHRAPHHHRQAEPVVGFHRGDRRDRAIVRDRGDDRAVGARLGRHLHGDVRLALVVEHDQLVFVLGFRVGVAQLDRELGRVAAADAVGRGAAGERTDEGDLDLVLGRGGQRDERQAGSQSEGDESFSPDHATFPSGGSRRERSRVPGSLRPGSCKSGICRLAPWLLSAANGARPALSRTGLDFGGAP